MPYGHHPLSWEGGRYIYKKGTCPFKQFTFRFHIIRPLQSPQIRNEASCKRTPVTLTQQGSSHNWQPVWARNDFSRLNGAMKVAGNYSVQRLRSQPLSYLPSLFPTPLIQFSRSLSLHDLAGIVDGLTMPHQKNSCLHCCKSTK